MRIDGFCLGEFSSVIYGCDMPSHDVGSSDAMLQDIIYPRQIEYIFADRNK